MAVILPLQQHKQTQSPPLDGLAALAALVAPDLAAVNGIILQKLENDVPMIPRLAGHIIAAGGKRLRPSLALAATHLCGYRGERHRPLAAAVELLHTATLLHDDVVDDSAERRALPTANALFGNAPSVLVGDYLLSRAFQLMVEDGSLDVLRILSATSAVIAQGEVLQLSHQRQSEIGEQTYLEIIRAKTAELFAAACRIGAVIAGKGAAEEEALHTFGLNLGIAFQIVDDVLDYAGDPSRLGKSLGDDFREGKVTLPVILCVHRGQEAERAFFKRAIENPARQHPADIHHAIDCMKRHGVFDDCRDRARHYGSIARDALGLFEDSAAKAALLGVVDFAIDREV